MTDTTNHADVIKDVLGMLDPCHRRAYFDALTALDALTRGLAYYREQYEFWYQSDRDHKGVVDAQSARIATLEAELADAQMAERERIIHIAQDIYTENAGHPSYGRQFARQIRAALAPSKGER